LSFFLHQEGSKKKNSLERAAKFYQQSTRDTSVKQAVEKIFRLENLSKDPHANHAMLLEGAVQIAMNNLLCKDFITQFFIFVNTYYLGRIAMK